jgi:ubiquinone/menaquinone biosynthesis C-methylase UbiE
MNNMQSDFNFKLMAFGFTLRDCFRPRLNILKEVGIKPMDHVLDFGCGPGSYILPLEELIGKEGKIFAVDVNPHAIRMVQDIVARNRLINVEAICSDCKISLKDNSIDVTLLYDILHYLNNLDDVLKELYRVLKPNGILSVNDHHMKENEIVSKVSRRSFGLLKSGKRTYTFSKLAY